MSDKINPLTAAQVEQFIESIYPSQDPTAMVQAQKVEAPPSTTAPPSNEPLASIKARNDKMAEEAKWDLSEFILSFTVDKRLLTQYQVYLLLSVMGTLFVLSCIMVSSLHPCILPSILTT